MDLMAYILAVKNAVKPTDAQVTAAVNEHLTAHPVTPGASEEEAKQIAQNKTDISTLKTTTEQQTTDISSMKGTVNQHTTDISDLNTGKVSASGWGAGKYLGTDSAGRVVEREAPAGGGGSTDSSENANKTLTFTGAVEATYDGTEEITVDIPTGGGGYMTANAKALFRTLLYGTVYDKDVLPDPATTIEAFLAELDVVVPDSGGGDSGGDSGGDEPEKATYTVTYNLTGVTSSNTAATITEGGSYTTVLTGAAAIETAKVMMGGVDITETAYNSTSGAITIAEVTGDIVITAAIADETLLYSLKDASFNGQTIVDTGIALFDESKDFTILFDFEHMSCLDMSFMGIVTDETVTLSYTHFLGQCAITNKNADTETIYVRFRVNASNFLINAPAQSSDANSRYYSAKLAITFDSASNKWNAYALNTETGESTEGTYTGAVATIANTIAIGGTTDRGKTSFTCNEFSIYNRVLSADEISAWMQ